MASAKNDALLARTVDGSLNIYDGGKSIGTACDKGLAARLGGCSYNIINNDDRRRASRKPGFRAGRPLIP